MSVAPHCHPHLVLVVFNFSHFGEQIYIYVKQRDSMVHTFHFPAEMALVFKECWSTFRNQK